MITTRYVYQIVCLVLIVLGSGTTVFAAENRDAVITQTITGTDILAPSVPSGLVGIGVSQTSIQLQWNASTDNSGVAGYVIWRDNQTVATTTSLSFIDTGLASSTAYQYYVVAFDAAGNYSASSSVVTVTTLAPSGITEGVDTGSRLQLGAAISNVTVTRGTSSVVVSFTTDRYVYAEIRITDGTTELQVQRSTRLAKDHVALFSDLHPDTTYTIQMTVFVDDRFVMDRYEYIINTVPLPDTTPPANVSSLRVVEGEKGIVLSWQNPTDDDFAFVRVVRSDHWFPTDLVDGWVVYEGTAEQWRDTALERPLYYTVFSIDTTGNRSSGAIVMVHSARDTDAEALPISTQQKNDDSSNTDIIGIPETSVSTTTQYSVAAYIEQLGSRRMVTKENTISIQQAVPFQLLVPIADFPPGLRSVVGTLQHPNRRDTFHFLLKRNEATGFYEATVGSLPDPGRYGLTVQWVDFASQTHGVIEGSILVITTDITLAPTVSVWVVGTALAVLLLLIIGLWYMRILLQKGFINAV